MFFIPNYSFYKSHRIQLIESLAESQTITVCCDMQGNKPENSRINFIDRKLLSTGLDLGDLLKSFNEVSSITKKSISTKFFFISVRLIFLGTLVSIFIPKKNFYFIFSGMGYLFTNNSYKTFFLRILFLIALFISSRILSNKSVCQNNDDFNYLKKIVGLKNLILIKGNGVDTSFYKLKKYNLNSYEPLKFLFAARFLRDKGLIELLEAVKQLNFGNADKFILGLAGSIDELNPTSLTDAELEKYKNIQNIFFLGYLNQYDLRECFYEYDVFVLPSYREGLPLSALQAGSSGMPLLLTDVPGCRECVLPNENGILVKPRSIDSAINGIEFFINNRNLISKMGKKSRQHIYKNFSNDVIFSEYHKIFTS